MGRSKPNHTSHTLLDAVYQMLAHHGLTERYRQAQSEDLQRGTTQYGAHRDDYSCSLGHSEHLLKHYGSQGQIKSFVLALNLTHYAFLHEHTGHPPILLLDDIFDKLDRKRLHQLFDALAQESMGQVVISTISQQDTWAEYFKPMDTCLIHIDNGTIQA